MSKQNWEAKADLIVNECFGEGATISKKTFDFVVDILSQTEQEVKERILSKLPEKQFIRSGFVKDKWKLGYNHALKEITDLINKI